MAGLLVLLFWVLSLDLIGNHYDFGVAGFLTSKFRTVCSLYYISKQNRLMSIMLLFDDRSSTLPNFGFFPFLSTWLYLQEPFTDSVNI